MQLAIFLCNEKTAAECLDKKLFGASAPYAKSVRKGDILLLYNVAERSLCGVWTAASDCGTFDLKAWGGGYPNQVRVALASGRVIGLPRWCFEDILGANSGWGRALTGTKAHNLLQYFAFDYQGTLGMGVPLHDVEKNYRAAYPAQISCADGHRVRFEEEQAIDDCLARLGIPHAYEVVMALPPVQLVPTFVVHKPNGKAVYVELAEHDAGPFDQARRAHKRKIYEERRFQVIEVTPKEMLSLDRSIAERLRAVGIGK